MNLEHLIGENFAHYLQGLKDEVASEITSTFGVPVDDVRLRPLKEYFVHKIQSERNRYRQEGYGYKKYLILQSKNYYQLYSHLLSDKTPAAIYLDENKTIYVPMDLGSRLSYFFEKVNAFKSTLVHEFGHHISTIINPLFKRKNLNPYIYQLNDKKDHFIEEQERLVTATSLDEGFASYLQLDVFRLHYGKKEREFLLRDAEARLKITARNLSSVPKDKLFHLRYKIGYAFFHEITAERGAREAFRALENADKLSVNDILHPQEYLRRFDAL